MATGGQAAAAAAAGWGAGGVPDPCRWANAAATPTLLGGGALTVPYAGRPECGRGSQSGSDSARVNTVCSFLVCARERGGTTGEGPWAPAEAESKAARCHVL
eukprot:COSAG01_NODE_19121_length_1029_cov_2.138710_1_plen_102_part_00